MDFQGEVIQRDCCCVLKQELDEEGGQDSVEGFGDHDPADAEGIEGGKHILHNLMWPKKLNPMTMKK